MDQDPGPDLTTGARSDRRSMPLVMLLPNLVTLLGLCAGLTSMRYVMLEMYEAAAALIVLAALVDGLDGMLARKLNAASPFGAELDSLSDFVCFGVAPGFFVYHFALQDLGGPGWIVVLVFPLGACLRLARFNVNRDVPLPPGVKPHFTGVPAPAGAMLGLLPVFLALAGWLDARQVPFLVALYLALVGVLMISRLPTPSLKAVRVPRSMALAVLLGVTLYLAALATRPWQVLVLTDLAYLAVVLASVFKAIRPRSKAA